MDAGKRFDELVAVMARLRGPLGCPWDKEQDLETLRPYLLEEAHEVLEAIASGDPDHHREELGDLLLQIVFQAQIAKEKGDFTVADVAAGITEKLVRRHPHVFGEREAATSKEVLGLWREVKGKEKGGRGIFDGVPATLSALLRARRVQERAAGVGFDWPDLTGVVAKIREEAAELEEAIESGHRERVAEELGDLLFAVVNLSRFASVDPEGALSGTTKRFMNRFATMERLAAGEGKSLPEMTLEEMDGYWERAKAEERKGGSDATVTDGIS